MTEDEAKTKACCGPEGCGEEMPPTDVITAGHFVRHSGKEGRFCIGSRCMGWRWITGHLIDTDGYCGYAGKP